MKFVIDFYGLSLITCRKCHGSGTMTEGDTSIPAIINYDSANIKKVNKKEGCFVTTAVCSSLGKSDNCDELMILRNFRDNYLLKTSEGNMLVQEYYSIAPSIVENQKLFNTQNFCNSIFIDYIEPIITYIKSEQFELSILHYKKMLEYIKYL